MQRRDVRDVGKGVSVPRGAARKARRSGIVPGCGEGGEAIEVGPGAVEIHGEAAGGMAGENGEEGVKEEVTSGKITAKAATHKACRMAGRKVG